MLFSIYIAILQMQFVLPMCITAGIIKSNFHCLAYYRFQSRYFMRYLIIKLQLFHLCYCLASNGAT